MPKLIGELFQNGGDFALLDSSNIRGGFMQVTTLKDRDNIVPDKLKKGMHVYVDEDEHIYEWKGKDWALYKVNSNDIDRVQFLTVSQEVEEKTKPLYNEAGEVTHWGIRFSEDILFHNGDIIGWNLSTDNDGNITGTFTEITFVRNNIAYISKSENDSLPDKYQTVYLVGSTSDVVRRCVMAIHPYHGAMVLSQFVNSSLDELNTHYTFRLGQHSTDKWKLYAEDVYLKGTFIDKQGRNLAELATITQDTINTGFTGIRREFGYDNLLENPYFIEGMDCWFTKSNVTYFRAGKKFIKYGESLLATGKGGAYIVIEDGQVALKILNGFVSQRNHNLKKFTDLDSIEPPYYVTLIFNYKPITSGTLKVSIRYLKNNNVTYQYKAQQYLQQDEEYHTWKSTFLWDGQGDFTIEYDGEIVIQTLVLKMNDVKNFEKKHQRLFELSDTLIKMAEEYLEQSN